LQKKNFSPTQLYLYIHWLIFLFLVSINPSNTLSPSKNCMPTNADLLNCTGFGRIANVPDRCIDDAGWSGNGDSLEIYCYEGQARFCLSQEVCPWRSSSTTTILTGDKEKTCSRAGLRGDFMARAWCSKWRNYSSYLCCEGGYIALA
jgi:hypothetical protein